MGNRDRVSRFESELSGVSPEFAAVLRKVPLQNNPPLPPDWLRCEMLERFQVIQHAVIDPGARVLEVGAGGHALATVPLAYQAGASGRVVAVDRARRSQFREVVTAAGMGDRVRPVACDARRLPFPADCFDLATCVHGIRSLRSEAIMLEVFREMLRIAPRIFLAESLPIARTAAQRAHLAMYDLREEIFEAVSGTRDDLRYLPLHRLEQLVQQAGGSPIDSRVLEVDLPHALAYLPPDYVQRIDDPRKREDFLRRWNEADQLRRQHGTDHPPVGMISAARAPNR